MKIIKKTLKLKFLKNKIEFRLVGLALGLLFALLIVNLVNAKGFYYSIELYYDGNISVKDINIEFSNEELSNLVNEIYFKTYEVWVLDKNNEKIKGEKFGILNKAYYDVLGKDEELVDGGLIELENVSFNVYIPYYENGEKIFIYDENGKRVTEVDVKTFSSSLIYEEIQKQEFTDKEKEVFYKELFKKKDENWLVYLVVFLLGLFLLFFLFKKIKLKSKKEY